MDDDLMWGSIFDTPEWKRRSRAFCEGKACEWCGSTEALGPHHRRHVRWGLREYKKTATRLFNEFKRADKEGIQAIEAQALKDVPPGDGRDLRKRARFLWEQAHRAEIKEAYEGRKAEYYREYMELTPETAMVLCRRCHYAREKGLVICGKCGKQYRRPKYPTCYVCASKKPSRGAG